MMTHFMKELFIYLCLIEGYSFQKQNIPEHLIECYKSGVLLLPMSMEVFIDLIRKFEISPNFLMDLRIFSTTLLHRFSRDGIEKDRDFVIFDRNVIPYTTTGFQSFKYQLLFHYLLPRSFQNLAENILTLEERCTLHFMLSSSVDIWERGDENLVCLESFGAQNMSSLANHRRRSSCPIEQGAVYTKGFGTVSLNHVISGIVAALHPLRIHLSELLLNNENLNLTQNGLIDNLWASTFAGDLSEILIIQKPFIKQNYFIGPSGKWNDTRMPIKYYLKANSHIIEKELWQFTDAEIMGAIDGTILADVSKLWLESRRMLRLSQLLELYYTDKYTNYLTRYHACKRNLYFNEISEKSGVLAEQVRSFSHLLANYIPNNLLEKSVTILETEILVNQFNNYVTALLRIRENCPQGIHTKLKIKLNVIHDHTWSHQETLTFLMNLAEKIDVFYHGSSITVIAGDISNVIVENCNTTGSLYYNWMMYVHDTGTMSLPKSLIKLNKIIDRERFSASLNQNQWYSHLTLVLGLSTILSDEDIADSIIMLKTIKHQHPDMVFAYVTSTPLAPMYVKLTTVEGAQDDKIISPTDLSYNQIINELDGFHFNPMAITPLFCTESRMKEIDIDSIEYVAPGSVNFYRIHPKYLCKVSKAVTIKIENRNYGNLEACISRDNLGNDDKRCHKASLNDKIYFEIKNPCPSKAIYGDHQSWNGNCKPIYLKIITKQSLSLCTEIECRFPDDVKFKVIVSGLQCSSETNDFCSGNENILVNFVNLLIIISLSANIVFAHQYC